jgi:hypothetical protein
MVARPPPTLLAKAVARMPRPLLVDDADRTNSSPPLATW